MASRASPLLYVDIGGTSIPACWVEDATDGIAPEVGSARIKIPLGKTQANGTAFVSNPSIAPRMPVVIASSDGAYAWRGEVIRTRRANQNGRWLMVECVGDGAAFQRAVLSTFREISYGVAGAFQTVRPRGLNENENADCSAATFAVGGLSCHVSDVYSNNRTLWNQLQAITTILGVGIADAGLPACYASDAYGLMTKQDTWHTAGRSVFASIGEIVGARSDAVWRIDRDAGAHRVLTILPARGGGNPVDLTSPYIEESEIITDGSQTLYGERAVGSKAQFILTLQMNPGSTGGDLIADWTADDVTALLAGNKSSPAYRRFTVNPAIALPDGSGAGNARLISGLPMQVLSLSGRTTVGGPGYSSEGLCAWQDSSSGTWISADGEVTITRRGDTNGVWVNGSKWIDIYLSAARVAFTVAMESCQNAEITNSGGDGAQWGFLSAGAGQVVEILSGTYLGVLNGTVVTSPAISYRNDIPRMTAVLAANWAWKRHDLVSVIWSELGTAYNGFIPGDVISQATDWDTDGTTKQVIPVDACVTRRTLRWTDKGISLRLSAQRIPPDLNAIAGQA